MPRIIKLLAGAALFAATVLATSPSYAGTEDGVAASCWHTADNYSYCTGSFRAFRERPGNSRADFYLNSYGAVHFYAQLDQSSYSCWFETGQYAAVFASTVGNSRDTYFHVTIAPDGSCAFAYTYYGSANGAP